MKQLKFKVWDKALNKWAEGITLAQDGEVTSSHPEHYNILLFTGLHDKNGKEIYEGDILKVPDNYNEYGFMAGEAREVYFSDGGFRLKPKVGTPKQRGHWLEDCSVFEIIGNIHENPKLL